MDNFPELKGHDPKVVLMGDSILDNFFWLQQPHQHLKAVLESRLASNPSFGILSILGQHWKCVSLAVDETSTHNFLERSPLLHPWTQYELARKKVFKPETQDHSYFRSSDGAMRQVENLSRLNNVKHVILSVGGNDLYLDANMQYQLLLSTLPFQGWRAQVEADKFEIRFKRILTAVQKAAPGAQVTLVIPFHPHYKFNLAGLSGLVGHATTLLQNLSLSSFVTPMVQKIFKLAIQNNLSVIDLSKVFDPHDETHYGTANIHSAANRLGVFWSGAEPSNLTNGWIANIILDIVTCPRPQGMVFHRNKHFRPTKSYLARYTFGPQAKQTF